MKLFARACLAVSIALVPVACGDDENTASPNTPDAAAECGNDVKDGTEECDGTDGLSDSTCADETMNASPLGSLTCSSTCTYVATGCSAASTGGAPGTGGRPPTTGGAPNTGGTGGGMGGTSMGGMMGSDAGDGGGSGGTGGGGTGGTPAEAGATDASTDASGD